MNNNFQYTHFEIKFNDQIVQKRINEGQYLQKTKLPRCPSPERQVYEIKQNLKAMPRINQRNQSQMATMRYRTGKFMNKSEVSHISDFKMVGPIQNAVIPISEQDIQRHKKNDEISFDFLNISK